MHDPPRNRCETVGRHKAQWEIREDADPHGGFRKVVGTVVD